jgi:hypothetical protein
VTDPERSRLRVGHAERDAATETLRDAAAEGRLTMEELEERLERALTARTYADLDALFVDLPGLSPDSAGPSAAVPVSAVQVSGGAVPAPPGYSVDDPMILDGGMGSTGRHGVWEVPPFIRIHGGAGTVRLDCQQAVARASVIDIEVSGGMGTMIIVLPDGWAANLDRLTTGWGSAKSDAPTVPSPGKPLLVLRGTVGMGSMTVRSPNWFDQRKLRKQLGKKRQREIGPG